MVAGRDTTGSGFPLVYNEWTVEREGQQEHFVIQDLPPEDNELALEFLLHNFIRDESTCKSINAISDEYAVQEMAEFWREKLSERTSLACYRSCQGQSELVGLNVCYICDKHIHQEDPITQLRSAAWKQILGTLSLMTVRFDPHAALGADRYLSAAGLLVAADQRGRGIALRLLTAREGLCKALGVSATATVFTATASQRVAAKCGFRELGALRYEELAARGWHFPDIDSPEVKVMGRTYS